MPRYSFLFLSESFFICCFRFTAVKSGTNQLHLSGYELNTYTIAGNSWPGSVSTAAPLGVGMYYEEANNLIWSLYNGPFGLAAWTPSGLFLFLKISAY